MGRGLGERQRAAYNFLLSRTWQGRPYRYAWLCDIVAALDGPNYTAAQVESTRRAVHALARRGLVCCERIGRRSGDGTDGRGAELWCYVPSPQPPPGYVLE